MALPLNVYKTLTGITSTSSETVYAAPVGYTGVILLAQVANTGVDTEQISFSYVKGSIVNELVPNSPVASEDAIKLLTGKLFVLSGDSLELSGTNATDLKYTISILETLN
jgi:hypothetical protein